METIAINFFKFLKNPKEKFNETLYLKEKWNLLFSILLLDFILVIIASGITSLIDLHLFELKSDPLEDLFSNKAAFYIIIIAALIVPLIEEFIFRLFLNYKRNFVFQFFDAFTNNKAKLFWDKHFKKIFYLAAILFALTHLTNYSNTNTLFYILAPLIILPQLIGGLTLGYIRLKLGFFWGVLMHGLYNLILFSVAILFLNITSLTKTTTVDYSLEITKLELGLNKPVALETYKTGAKIDSIIVNNSTVKEVATVLNATDTTLLKNSNRINIRFINKTDINNVETLILNELKKHFK
ncbi:CPBP family intramembrane metalloprotease [Lutibacter sp. A64]|uniref:CPBP family intramembrane glutamic endopeptidase n=1 Tax=Lutibacter sp. A64 TaxID=2918526 RepID=UPI001F064E37|nr:CPBP family intramembrane glutamic endopeptidase [Lutibacter sp. A64]UMB52626.1 CPBP family intramembrane metalloprotease [Lutibacter sp. A64]